jgi:kynureninase
MFNSDLEYAVHLDELDELSEFRSRFFIPKDNHGADKIYLCGNSLGLQPRSARAYVEQEMKDWERLGVEGHSHAQRPWMPYHEILTEQMAQIVGAKPLEVVVMNSLTVNLHLLLVSFYRPTKSRFRIMIEKGAFPSDRYAVCSQINFHGYKVEDALIEVAPRQGETLIREEDILDLITKYGDEIALIMFGNVNYYSGQAFDMYKITRAGHAKGCIVGFDLAHGAGNLYCDLHETGADFAAWCSYKYLNSGPGGLSGIFVHERHAFSPELPRFAGWWGHEKETRFLMGPDFRVLPGAEGWQLSNPPILPMATLKASLDIFEEAGISKLRSKSMKLSQYMIDLLKLLPDDLLEVISPEDPEKRGSQVSVRMKNKDKQLFNALQSNGVVSDWREPDVIRVAPVPLYNSFADVHNFYRLVSQYLIK